MRVKNQTTDSLTGPSELLVREYIEVGGLPYQATPQWFAAELSDLQIASSLMFNNFVNLSIPGGSTRRSALERIATGSSRPFAIKTLPDLFDSECLIRGESCFGHVWKVLDEVATNWPNMRWWYSEGGLGMAILTQKELDAKARIKCLDPFDQLAGKMFFEGMKNGRVSRGVVIEIARALDVLGFTLRENLKPSDWRPIADYNQKYARRAVSTFEKAIEVYARGIRRRLSEAKQKYERALEI